jgi:AcrR family transcriptional regulator
MGESERRDAILYAAERLLAHYGFTKTTVADIAREANVGVGSVYLEFQSKAEIVAELSVRRHRGLLEAMRAVAADHGDLGACLSGLFRERAAGFARIVAEGQHGSDLVTGCCAAVHEVRRRFRGEEVQLLAELLGDHPLPSFTTAEALAQLLLSLHDHLGLEPDDSSWRLTLELLLRGLQR